MFAHFSEIAKSVKGFPIMLYNVPSRTSSNISAETTLRLAEKHENIVATKEASGNYSQVMQILKGRPKNFKVFSGDDASTLPLIALGADGLVSVCSNEIPKETSKMVEHASERFIPFCTQDQLQDIAADGGELYRIVARSVQIRNEGNGPVRGEPATAARTGD